MLFFSSLSYWSNSVSELQRGQSRCSTGEQWMCFPPSQIRGCMDQQDLGEAASQRGTVTPGSCPPISCLWTRLPLNFRPSWTGHHDSHCLHSILAAVPNFAVPWHTCLPLCIRWQQSRSALNDIQKCKFCSPWQSYQLEQSALEHYGVWGRSRVWAPCLVTPNWSLLKSEEVFHYFQLSVDPFKPESQYLLNTAFHTWTLCKAEQKEYAIYKHVEASIMKFFMFL